MWSGRMPRCISRLWYVRTPPPKLPFPANWPPVAVTNVLSKGGRIRDIVTQALDRDHRCLFFHVPAVFFPPSSLVTLGAHRTGPTHREHGGEGRPRQGARRGREARHAGRSEADNHTGGASRSQESCCLPPEKRGQEHVQPSSLCGASKCSSPVTFTSQGVGCPSHQAQGRTQRNVLSLARTTP